MVSAGKEDRPAVGSVWMLLFLVLNAAGLGLIVWGVVFREVRVEDIRIVNYSPKNEAIPENTGEIMLEFSTELDPQTVTEDTLSLRPRVEGQLELAGPKGLRLILRDPLNRATRYQVNVSPALRGIHGESLGEYNCEFNTPALAVNKVAQGSVDAAGGINLDITFNEKVDPRDLSRALTLKYKGSKKTPEFSVRGRTPAKRLQVHIPDYTEEVVLLNIKSGLAGVEGPLALERAYAAVIRMTANTEEVPQDLSRAVSTVSASLDAAADPVPAENVVYVSQKVLFTGMRAENDYGTSRIIIEANAPFDAAEAATYISINPAVACSFESRYSGLVIKGDFDAGKRYQVTLNKGLPAGIAGVLEDTVSRSVWFADRGEDIEFTYGGGYLSPEGRLLVPVKATNVKEVELTVCKLYPENIVEYVLTGEESISSMRASEIAHERIQFNAAPNKYEEKLLDLRKFAGKKLFGVYSLSLRSAEKHWNNSSAVVVVSDLGIISRVAEDAVLCWVSSLSTAKPVAGAEVSLYSDHRQKLGTGRTDNDGLCRINYPRLPENESAAVLVVQKVGDTSYLGLNRNQRRRGEEASRGRPYLKKGYEAFLTAERGVYRPGDTVRVAAFVRGKDVTPVKNIPLELRVVRPDGKELLRKPVVSDMQGRISIDVVLPNSVVTGYYGFELTIPGEKTAIGSGGFRVEDYIPQTLSMKLQTEDSELFPGVEQQWSLSAQVKHLFGQPAGGLKIDGKILCRAEEFSPAGWEGYIFTPRSLGKQTREDSLSEETLNKEGRVEFELACLQPDDAPVVRETVEITAYEKGGRTLSEKFERKFYPWKFYIGIKPPADTLKVGQIAEFELAVLGRDGKAYARDITWEAELYVVNWVNVLRKQEDGRIVYDWSRKEKLAKTITGLDQVERKLRFIPENPGHYMLKIRAEGSYPVVYDFYIPGEDGKMWVRQDPDEIKLLPDMKMYKSGQTARVSLQAPFAGTALVCVEGDTILQSRVVPLQQGSNCLEFVIQDSWRPNVYVSVTLVRAVQAEEKWLPHRVSGVARLAVACQDKKLQVTLGTVTSASPEEKTAFKIHVTGADGTVVPGAAVVFAAVDEGVLRLDDFKMENPWDFFYALRRLDVAEADMYSRLAPELSAWRVVKEAAPGGGGAGDKIAEELSRRLNPVKARRVRTAVLYAGTLQTDEHGDAVVDFVMPEYIGKLRLMALVADGVAFGMVQQPLPVQAPLMYKASWPRFLAPEDVFTVSLTLFNKTGRDGNVVLDLQENENLELLTSDMAEVWVKSGEQKTVELVFRAGGIGLVKCRLQAVLNGNKFTRSVELPVRSVGLFARKSMLSVVKPGKTLKLELAGEYLPGSFSGNLAVTSNPVAGVSGQLNYLLRYPYGCLEQTVSRMLPLLYMPDLARIVCPGAVGKEETDTLLTAGLERLLTMQTWSGGLAMWPGNSKPSAWGTVYAADFMVEAKKAGYQVPADLLNGALEYLSANLGYWLESTDSRGVSDQLDVAAYAAYVLCRGGRTPHSWLASLEEHLAGNTAEGGNDSTTARCYLAAVYLLCGEAESAREFVESLSGFVVTRTLGGTFSSPLREKAILLSTLLDVTPESPRIPALVAGLRVDFSNPWQASTQENAFALQALGKYARRIEIDPDAKATVSFAGKEEVFNSAVGKSLRLDSPDQKVTVGNNGSTPVYVYVFSEGVPVNGKVAEEDSGLAIRRYITDIKNNSVTGELRQGQLYRIHLELKAPRPLAGLVLVDMLAAGLEIENQDLRGSATLDSTPKQKGMRIKNVEKRDDRVIIFAEIPEGRAEYSYIVRAVSPGEFSWPACDVSAMYDPAVFSVHDAGKLKVIK